MNTFLGAKIVGDEIRWSDFDDWRWLPRADRKNVKNAKQWGTP